MQVYTIQEVQRHASPSDAWIIVKDHSSAYHFVHDVTTYLPHHPATQDLIPYLGSDATEFFYNRNAKHIHGDEALLQLSKHRIGILDKNVVTKPRFDHIAFAVASVNDILPFAIDTLGGSLWWPYINPFTEFAGGQLKYSQSSTLEFLQPSAPTSFLTRFLKRQGPGIHHITFKVKSLDQKKEELESLGFNVLGFTKNQKAEWRELFIHPSQTGGIVIQFAQEKPEPERYTSRVDLFSNSFQTINSIKISKIPENPPVLIVGLALTYKTEEFPLKMWENALEGKCDRSVKGKLIFSWDSSPMKIFVTIDPNANQIGPTHIEVLAPNGHPCIPKDTNQLKNELLGTLFIIRTENNAKL